MIEHQIKEYIGGETDVYIASLSNEENKYLKGAVSHTVGSDEILIQSTSDGWGSVPYKGRDNLKLMRDALIRICEMEKIE